MTVLKTGCDAFIEGVNGRYIPCKVLSVKYKEYKGIQFILASRNRKPNEEWRTVPCNLHHITVQVTSTKFGYHEGEVLEYESSLHIIPRKALDLKLRRILAYSVTPDEHIPQDNR